MKFRDEFRLAGASSLLVGSLILVGVSLLILVTPQNTAVLTTQKPSSPGPPSSFVASCYESIERQNRDLRRKGSSKRVPNEDIDIADWVTGKTEDGIVPPYIDPLDWGTKRVPVEKCLALAGVPITTKPLPAPTPTPPQWIQEEKRLEWEWRVALWRYRALWVGLPFLGMIAGSSFALIGLRRTVRAFEGVSAPIRLGWRRILVGILLLLFAWFVWPTPYLYIPGPKGVPLRVNRLTGEVRLVHISAEP
jgi:hypothetical protein